MRQQPQNSEPQVQEIGSGFIDLYNLSRLTQTVDSIAVEARDEEEMLQLTINALCIFTGWPLGHIFLRDATHKIIFRCSEMYYVRRPDLYEKFHQEALSSVYDDSSPIIKELTVRSTPYIQRGFKVISPSDVSASFKVLIPLISRGKLFGFFELVAPEGGEEPNKHLLQVFHQIGYRIGSVLDSFITADELEVAKNKSEALLASMGDGVFAIDREQNLVHLNRRAEEMSGYKASEVLGKPYYDYLKFVKEKDGSENIAFVRDALRGELTKMGNHTMLIRKDGRSLPVADTAAPLKDQDGKIIGGIVVFRDATQERKAEHISSEFASLVTHQLKTPITIIKGYLAILTKKDENLTKKQNESLDEITAATNRLLNLVEDLLNVARLEEGRIKIKTVVIDSVDLIEDIVKESKQLLERKDQKLILKKRPNLPKIKVDLRFIKEPIYNLLSNASKYTPEKGQIIFEIFQIHNELIFRITDSGVGIPEQEQSKVFERFFRASNVIGIEKGTGLGLYIAKLMIELSGGRIWFQSKENEGTTFFFALPALEE